MTGTPREFSFVYVTCPSEAVALALAENAVTRKLAACANVLPEMKSVYVWKGELTRDEEVVLVLKTRARLVNELTAFIVIEHPYEVPCVVELPIESGSESFLEFLREGTKSE